MTKPCSDYPAMVEFICETTRRVGKDLAMIIRKIVYGVAILILILGLTIGVLLGALFF